MRSKGYANVRLKNESDIIVQTLMIIIFCIIVKFNPFLSGTYVQKDLLRRV
jgi:hypothetical protein